MSDKINYADKFIRDAKEKHNNKYDYSLVEYVNLFTKVKIICPTHGEFEQTPCNHIKTKGCVKCGSMVKASLFKLSNDDFIKAAKDVHQDRYDYSLVDYKNSKTNVDIICREHGVFQSTLGSHIHRRGHCPSCANKNRGRGTLSSYTRSGFIAMAKDRLSTFYIIRCFNQNESFYKLGITCRSVKQRYANKTTMPYSYEIIREVFGSAGDIWDMESKIKVFVRQNLYQPLIAFDGSKSECVKDLSFIDLNF